MGKTKYSKEIIEELVRENFSIRAIILKLGLKEAGGNYSSIKKKIEEYGLDISHFHGRGWSKGRTKFNDKRIKTKYSFEEIFCENSVVAPKHFKKFLKNFIEYKCSVCGNTGEWFGEEIVLEVEHKNGKHNDNRLENLCFLCPNCHSQTKTFRGRCLKGTKRKKISEEIIIKNIKESKSIREVLIKVSLTPKGGNYVRIKRIMEENNLVFELVS